MGRKQDRKAAEGETSAVAELCRVQRKYVPELFELFEATADPRNQSLIQKFHVAAETGLGLEIY